MDAVLIRINDFRCCPAEETTTALPRKPSRSSARSWGQGAGPGALLLINPNSGGCCGIFLASLPSSLGQKAAGQAGTEIFPVEKKNQCLVGGRFAACGGLRARGRRGAPGEDTGSPWGGCGRPGAPCPREMEGMGIPPTDRWDLKVPLKVKIKMLFG